MSLNRLKRILEKSKKNREKLEKKNAIKRLRAVFQFKPFSPKQRKLLNWWHPESPVKDKKGIIADGAIRSGKTIALSLSFMLWAMSTFDDQNFGMAGKTIGSFRRNVVKDLKKMAYARSYKVIDRRSESYLEIKNGDIVNRFYIFGGKDEGSQDLIQGITLAGMFFDEVVLMPKSFVTQATGRCSIDGSKFWFTCNPGSPAHWFKEEWLDKKDKQNLLHVHFVMEDNYSLTQKTLKEYRSRYTGVFYKRYILGLWVGADGLVYELDDESLIAEEEIPKCDKYYIAGDYGTQNPMAWGFFGVKRQGKTYYVYLIAEYHYSGKSTQRPKDDSQYTKDFIEWKNKLEKKYGYTQFSVFDPSAASFKIALQNKGIKVKNAVNTVKGQSDEIAGIPLVQTYLSNGKFFISNKCKETIAEFYSYAWDSKKLDRGIEEPIKVSDHHMDKIRYFFNTVIGFERLDLSLKEKPKGF